MNEILIDFQKETKALLSEMTVILESIEMNPALYANLERYGQVVDRVMGTAQSLVSLVENNPHLKVMGDFARIGKMVGYRASQVGNNPQLTTVVVAFLLDATEMLGQINESLGEQQSKIKSIIGDTFLDRLKWISEQFDQNLRATVGAKTGQPDENIQDEVNKILRKMGVS